jgi:dihydrofolate reductase
MPGPDRIEGYAIISSDGMLADATGVQPNSLRIGADQKFFLEGLARSDAVAHGRHSAEGGTHPDRRRLILTRQIASLQADDQSPLVVHWNPAGASLGQAWRMLKPTGGLLAVIGGTDVFGHFLQLGYSAFYLTRVDNIRLHGGRAVFPGVPKVTPEELLSRSGLRPSRPRLLDAASGATLVTWQR